MARVLVISSFVAFGRVGLAASVPALVRTGHEVISLPTVVLSNHPGHAHTAGQHIAPAKLAGMLEALEGNGWLESTDAVLTGYLPSRDHVRFAAAAASKVSALNPRAEICCDPILGDDPAGLYIAADAAEALRDELVPLADVVFPNRFELSFLARLDASDIASAIEAARELKTKTVVATSVPAADDALANILVVAGDAAVATVPRRPKVPHGTGDLMSGLFLGHRLNGGRPSQHLGQAVAGVEVVLSQSLGREQLALEDGLNWANAAALPVARM